MGRALGSAHPGPEPGTVRLEACLGKDQADVYLPAPHPNPNAASTNQWQTLVRSASWRERFLREALGDPSRKFEEADVERGEP